MRPLEIAMQGVGWLGMALILCGFFARNRARRQFAMSAGAILLAAMAAFPQMQPVFFCIELAIAAVGFINMRNGHERLKIGIILMGALVASIFAFRQGLGLETWLAVAGLTGIAMAYGQKTEKEGGHQFLWFGVGGLGMAGYSFFGVLAGVWQAWPFLLLNIPFIYIGFNRAFRA